jgi:hypothetical protein
MRESTIAQLGGAFCIAGPHANDAGYEATIVWPGSDLVFCYG